MIDKSRSFSVVFRGITIPILHENNHFLIINKVSGIACQIDKYNSVSLLTILEYYLCKKYKKPGRAFISLVHRLDKYTSGIMIVAKTSKCVRRINKQFQNHQVRKRYLIIVAVQKNQDLPVKGVWKDYLIHDVHRYRTMISDSSVGKPVKLAYRIMGEVTIERSNHKKQRCYVIIVRTYTGRYHQIRGQFSSRGWPILGDQKYGEVADAKLPLSLHSYQISFLHPITQQRVRFSSSLPEAWPLSVRKLSDAWLANASKT